MALLRNVSELLRCDAKLHNMDILVLAPQRNEDCLLLDEDCDEDLDLEALVAALCRAQSKNQPEDSPEQAARVTNIGVDVVVQALQGMSTSITMKRILQRVGSRCYEFRAKLSDVGKTARYHIVFDVGLFDSLDYSDTNAVCQAIPNLLVPGGLFVVASGESEAYGVLRSGMRGLRPVIEDRVQCRPFGDGSNSLHVYRKSVQDSNVGHKGDGESSDDDDLPPPLMQHCERGAREQQRRKPAPAMDVASFKQEIGGRETAYKAFARAMCGDRDSQRGTKTSVFRELCDIQPVLPDWVADSIDLAQILGSGRGLVTRCARQAGDLLFVDNSVFLAPAQALGESVLGWLAKPETSMIEKQRFYACCSGSARDAELPCHMSFYTSGGDPTRDDGSGVHVPDAVDPDHVYRILKLNACQADRFHKTETSGEVGADKLVGLWPLVALMNHSCCPTAIMVPLGSRTLACIAACDLPVGAELTIRYTTLDVPHEERQMKLQETKEFRCKCERCQAELSGMSTGAIAKLLKLRDALGMLELASGTDILPTLETTAGIFRQELHKAADDWFLESSPSTSRPDCRASAAALFKGSFLHVFLALAISHERSDESCEIQKHGESIPERRGRCLSMAESMQLERAWREVCEVHEQMEPCSEAHLQAACRRLLAAEASQPDQALRYCFSIWLGRHGTTAIIDKTSPAATRFQTRLRDFNVEERASAVNFFALFFTSLKRPVGSSPATFHDAWMEQLNKYSEWTAALDLLGSFGAWSRFWASRATHGNLGKPIDSERQSEPPCFTEHAHVTNEPLKAKSEQADTALYEWEQLNSTTRRLKIYGMTSLSEVDLEVSETCVRVTYAQSGCRLEIDICVSAGSPLAPALANDVQARFMKQSKCRHRACLQLDLPFNFENMNA